MGIRDYSSPHFFCMVLFRPYHNYIYSIPTTRIPTQITQPNEGDVRMNDQPDTSVSKAMQESLKNYLKELWNALWIVVWGVLWYQYYENVNPYNQADQL